MSKAMSNKEQNVTSNIDPEIVKSNRILSLSGGGVKGIAELVVLAEIEERTGKYITELFPIITGTSVGGLIGALLTIPKELGSSESKYSAKQALEIFKEAAPKIFEHHWYDGIKQIFTHKHSQEPLKEILEQHLAELRLDDTTSRLIIPVTDLASTDKEVKIFDSNDSYSPHIRVQDVLLATTAAPTYFKPVTNKEHIKGYKNQAEVIYAYADGGLGANRPAYEALKILKSGHSREENARVLDDTMVLSLNFDNDSEASSSIPKIGFDGVIGWLVKGKLVSRLMQSREDSSTEEVRVDLPGEDEFYEVKLPITKETSSLDNAKVKNIEALEEVGRQYIKEHDQQLQKLCDNLLHNYNKEQNMKGAADIEYVLDDMLVADKTIDKIIISEELAQKLGANLNEQQVSTIAEALASLSTKESGMVEAFLQNLNDDQVIALSKLLPVIADGEFKDTKLGEFNIFQNKFLQVFSNMFTNQDEFKSEASLNANDEYTTEIVCDGRGSELSHHIDIGVEA